MNMDKNSFNLEKIINKSCKMKKGKNLLLMMASNRKSQTNQTINLLTDIVNIVDNNKIAKLYLIKIKNL
jgi:hypothetical protein